LRAIKESWVSAQLLQRQTEYTSHTPCTVFVGTWNVNGKLSSEDLGAWLLGGGDTDLYVIGLQEVDLSAEAFLLNESTRESLWTASVESCLLNRPVSYRRVAVKQMVGILLCVYARSDWFNVIRDVSVDSAGCGILGMMGNKGAVAARLRLFDSTLCFVNSHLAADSKEVGRRNQDYAEICRRINFGTGDGASACSLWNAE
jgi:phosphatidylinositol-bisphosphatase